MAINEDNKNFGYSEDEILKIINDKNIMNDYVFVKDYEFTSLSSAASVPLPSYWCVFDSDRTYVLFLVKTIIEHMNIFVNK